MTSKTSEIDNRFVRAFKTAGKTSLIALVIGIVLVAAAKYSHLAEDEANAIHYLSGIILEHVGLGLIVSAIAVFAFEWLVHTEENVHLTNSLNEAVENIRKDTEALQKMKAAAGKDAFESGIGALFGTKSDGTRFHFENNIVQIVNDAYELKQVQNTETVQYLNAISWLLWHTVRDNTNKLLDFAKGTDIEWLYSVPQSAAQMASRILGAQMKVMSDGDSYSSVSRIDLYEQDQLYYFFEKTEEALYRGVNVRRIFNFAKPSQNEPSESEIILEEAQGITEILEAHVALAQRTQNKTNGKYELRFFNSNNEAAVHGVIDQTSQRLEKIVKATFGLFNKKDAEKLICFEAIESDPPLSELRLYYAKKKSPEMRLFNSMWENSNPESPFRRVSEG